MASRSRLRKKMAPEFTPAPTQNVVQTRPFAPLSKSEIAPTLADVQAQLDHTQRFGHHLANFANAQSTPPIIQTKLTIGAPGDKYEQEADRVAGQVVQQLQSPQMETSQEQRSIQRESMPEDDELQMQPLTDQIQREEMPEDDELQMQPMLQMQGGGAISADPELGNAIQQSCGSGRPLAEPIRQPMEHAFGNVDFSGVKVHTDARSDQLNRSIQAKAFTTGQDIFFRQGAYQPGSRGGQELIAHELTHVVQQKGDVVQRLSQKSETSLQPTPTQPALVSTVVQRRGENPHAKGSSHKGWDLTAHHIIAHSKLSDAYKLLKPAEKQKLLSEVIPKKLTVTMIDNVKVNLTPTERQNPDVALADIRAKLVDPNFNDDLRGTRVNDVRESFFEWMGGNQFFGPNTSIRPEPSPSKDDIDTDGQFFTNANYEKLKEQGDALYAKLAEQDPSSGDILAILLEIANLAKDASPDDFDPAAWVEIGSMDRLQKLAENKSLDRKHILDYAFFKLPTPSSMGPFPTPYEAIKAVNAGISEFDYGTFKQVPSQVGSNLVYFSLSSSKSVASSATVQMTLSDVIDEVAHTSGKNRDQILTVRSDDNNSFELNLDVSQYKKISGPSLKLRLVGYEGVFPVEEIDQTMVVSQASLDSVKLSRNQPGESLYDYLATRGTPVSSYLPRELYRAYDTNMFAALKSQVQSAIQDEDNKRRRLEGLSKQKQTKNTAKSIKLAERQYEDAKVKTIQSHKQLEEFSKAWKGDG